MHRVAGLEDVKLLDDFEHDVRNIVDAIGAIGFYTTNVDVGKIVVSATFAGGDTDFGWGRVVVDLNPETTQQFLGPVAGEGAGGDFFFVERGEVLVEVTGVHRIPAIEFGDGA